MKDLTRKRFGRLVALKPVGKNTYGNYLWLCKCDCGNEHIVASGKLVQEKTKSCGCYSKEIHIKSLEKHGITTGGKPRTFIIWNGMKARCYNQKSISYKSYGARGIKVCDEWLGEKGFENFHNWSIKNGYKEEFELDRIDNDGNYEPNNCRWISRQENREKQRNTRYFEIDGEKHSISKWCKILGISKSTAYKRVRISEKEFIEFITKRKYEKAQMEIVNKFIGGKNE